MGHLHSPIFESEFIHGYREQGGILPPEWKKLAKLVDLLSLCEFLNAPTPRNALRHTNLRSEKQFSNEVRRETTHVGLVPVNAGWYQEVTGLIVGTLEHWEEFGRQIE